MSEIQTRGFLKFFLSPICHKFKQGCGNSIQHQYFHVKMAYIRETDTSIWYVSCHYNKYRVFHCHNIDQYEVVGHNYKVNTHRLMKLVRTLFLQIDDIDYRSNLVDSPLTRQSWNFKLNEILTQRSNNFALYFQNIKLLLRHLFPHFFLIIPKLNSLSLSLKHTNPNLLLANYPNIISKLILYNLIIYIHYTK